MVVAEQLLQFLRLCGLAAGRAAERGCCRFCGVPGPFGSLAGLMDRRVAVLGGGHGGQGILQPPCCLPDRLGQRLACQDVVSARASCWAYASNATAVGVPIVGSGIATALRRFTGRDIEPAALRLTLSASGRR